MATIHCLVETGIFYSTLCGHGNDASESGCYVTCEICRKLRGLKPLTEEQRKRIETRWDKES